MSARAGHNYYSDYGSGSSTNSSSTWPPQETWTYHQTQRSLDRPVEQKSSSYQDLVTGKCTLEEIMKEFQMNGLDSPYTPVEDRIWSNHADGLVGMGPASAYLRQKSWPAPECSPAAPLPRPAPVPPRPAPTPPRPRSLCFPEFNPQEFTSSTPVEEIASLLSEEQVRALWSLPDAVLYHLLNYFRTQIEESQGDLQRRFKRMVSECRFCKNNGERESYYRSHALKDARGRVTCPVLRAFVCARCRATGDAAHTTKYCPLSTADERMKSTAMMRSVRMASGRRRTNSLAPSVSLNDNYMVFGETTPSVISDTNVYNSYALSSPLDPSWAALEQKLLL